MPPPKFDFAKNCDKWLEFLAFLSKLSNEEQKGFVLNTENKSKIRVLVRFIRLCSGAQVLCPMEGPLFHQLTKYKELFSALKEGGKKKAVERDEIWKSSLLEHCDILNLLGPYLACSLKEHKKGRIGVNPVPHLPKILKLFP
jgi:hypothetical protein